MSTFETLAKPVGETRLIVADFVSRLPEGATISSATVTQSVYSGAASTLTLGAASVSGTTVSATASVGTAGVIYQLTFQANLSDAQVLLMRTLLAVVPNAI